MSDGFHFHPNEQKSTMTLFIYLRVHSSGIWDKVGWVFRVPHVEMGLVEEQLLQYYYYY